MKLSVVIPTCNAGHKFKALLEKIKEQTLSPDEIIIADSESDDETCAVAKEFGVRIISIRRSDFDHGGTRSMAAQSACGDIILFMTQDAYPADEHAFENMINVFADESVSAAYGRQLPAQNASTAAAHLREYNYPVDSHVRSYEDRAQYGIKTAFLSNSFSAYRRNSLQKAGYFKDNLIFGEDAFTAASILRSGGKIVYCACAKVFHSHNYTLTEEFRRAFDTGVFHTDTGLAQEFGAAESEGKRYVVSLFKTLIHKRDILGIGDAVLRIGCKVIGYKAGRIYKKLPCAVCRFFSLNRAYWKTRKPS